MNIKWFWEQSHLFWTVYQLYSVYLYLFVILSSTKKQREQLINNSFFEVL